MWYGNKSFIKHSYVTPILGDRWDLMHEDWQKEGDELTKESKWECDNEETAQRWAKDKIEGWTRAAPEHCYTTVFDSQAQD